MKRSFVLRNNNVPLPLNDVTQLQSFRKSNKAAITTATLSTYKVWKDSPEP